jgi:hypothetical protein
LFLNVKNWAWRGKLEVHHSTLRIAQKNWGGSGGNIYWSSKTKAQNNKQGKITKETSNKVK